MGEEGHDGVVVGRVEGELALVLTLSGRVDDGLNSLTEALDDVRRKQTRGSTAQLELLGVVVACAGN